MASLIFWEKKAGFSKILELYDKHIFALVWSKIDDRQLQKCAILAFTCKGYKHTVIFQFFAV